MEKKRFLRICIAASMLGSLFSPAVFADEASPLEETEIIVFAAKSLNTVLDESIIPAYHELQPNVKITPSYDSSGTLMTQIEEGDRRAAGLSALQRLSRKGLYGRHGLACAGRVCRRSRLHAAAPPLYPDRRIYLHGGSALSHPPGGLVPEDGNGDNSAITTQEVSEALDGLEINECANVGAVAAAVAEGANEVGTVYYSDTYGLEDRLIILEKVPYDLTGNVIYPAAQIVNEDADDAEEAAAADFAAFLTSDTAKAIFDSYYFDTDLGADGSRSVGKEP